MSLSDMASIAALIGATVSIYLAVKKTPHETASLDANAAKSYAEAAQLSAERAELAEKRLQAALSEIDVMKTALEQVKAELVRYRDENTRLLQGIRRLLAQMQAHQIEPVWTPEETEPAQDNRRAK